MAKKIPTRSAAIKTTSRKAKPQQINEPLSNVFRVHEPVRYEPKTKNQEQFVKQLKEKDLIIAYGPAGTGKTVMTMQVAIDLFQAGEIDRIIVTRPMVVLEKNIGALPGELSDKFGPYIEHAMEYFQELMGGNEVKQLMSDGAIDFIPMSFLRGKTFKRTFVVLDEMQNSSQVQMKTALTRLGEGSKMAVLGDLKQQDLQSSSNGLKDLIQRVRPHPNVGVTEFTRSDILRHGLITDILGWYESDD